MVEIVEADTDNLIIQRDAASSIYKHRSVINVQIG
jgi:hypothetical protein